MMTHFRASHLHQFEASGKPFLYLQSAAIFALDDASQAILKLLDGGSRTREDIQGLLGTRLSAVDLDEGMDELLRVQAVVPVNEAPKPVPKVIPLEPFP